MQRIFNVATTVLLLQFATAAFPSVEGEWDVADHPHLSVTAFGQPVSTQGFPTFPKTMQLSFVGDPNFPDTGTFTSDVFSGDWKVNKRNKLKGTAATGMVEAAIQSLLSRGNFQGIAFSNGQLIRTKNTLNGKELKNGNLKGKFVHSSTWKVEITKPQQMKVPIQVRLVMPFVATPRPAQ